MEVETTIPEQEESFNPYAGVNMGLNIKYVRESRRLLQKELAHKINVPPRTMSRIEAERIIQDDELLNNIAAVLDCDVNFLKNYKLGEGMKSFYSENNTQTNTYDKNSHENIVQNQGDQENIVNNNCPITEIKDMFLQVMKDKDDFIMRYINEMQEIKRELEELKRKK